MTTVHAVTVTDRDDATYVFADEADAERFLTAVQQAGGDAVIDELPVIDSGMTDELIAQELDS